MMTLFRIPMPWLLWIATLLIADNLQAATLQKLPPTEITDIGGLKITIPAASDKAIVLIFLSTVCPICNQSAPELQRLAKDYSRQAVKFILVQTEVDLTAAAAKKHAAEFGLASTIVLDPERKLSKATGATTTPEAVVVSPEGQILYRGRINDRFPELGKDSIEPRNSDLRQALDEILAGKPVSKSTTTAVGCVIE